MNVRWISSSCVDDLCLVFEAWYTQYDELSILLLLQGVTIHQTEISPIEKHPRRTHGT